MDIPTLILIFAICVLWFGGCGVALIIFRKKHKQKKTNQRINKELEDMLK